MGREIRMVKPGWEHPKDKKGNDLPLYDLDYDTVCANWYEAAARWFHDYEGSPPNEAYYRKEKWAEGEATYFQLYETVSEGTPVSPAFATKHELIDYLVEHGDFYGQKRGECYSRKSAEQVVNSGYAPSMITTNGKIYMPEQMGDLPHG